MKKTLSPRMRLTVAAIALAVCLTAARPASAQQDPVYLKTLQATGFVVIAKENNNLGYGTCWIVDHHKRLVVTNTHVVGNYDKCKVAFPRMSNGKVVTASGSYTQQDYIPGKVLARDPKRDLALIRLDRLPAGTRALVLAPNSITEGGKIWAVGNCGMAGKQLSEGTLWRLRQGTIKRGFFWRTSLTGSMQKLETRVINTDSGSKPGDSGGPVVDEQGRLVGVNSCANDNGDYATDVNEVRTFLVRCVPSPNLPAPSRGPVGTWTVNWKHKDRDNYAGLALNANNTGHWDGAKICPGTYVYADGKLTLNMPGSGVQVTTPVTWVNNDMFRFTVQFSDGTIEFTATRR